MSAMAALPVPTHAHATRALLAARGLQVVCCTDGACVDGWSETLARAGWAAAFPAWLGLSMAQPLVGLLQTPYRAELAALTYAVSVTGGWVHAICDCWSVVLGAWQVLSGGPWPRLHQDLWCEFARWAGEPRTAVSWIRAHQLACPHDVPLAYWVGNAVADAA
eukprot:895865-Lingulodinium_polyedra.AAC.1